MQEWSRAGRQNDFVRLLNERWDVLIIGGGITGAGIALDAASRGLKTALVEKADFAGGTSSKSSKLIHGGLRYLGEFQFRTTFEAAREKTLLGKLAPHLVQHTPFLFANPRGLGFRLMLSAGLWIYDWAAGFPVGRRHRHVKQEEFDAYLPGLSRDRFKNAFLYYDAQADDCRLTMHVLKRAVTFGAVVLNYVSLDRFEHDRGQIQHALIRDVPTNQSGAVSARSFINATGVWCDEIRRQDDSQSQSLIRPSKGIHIVVPRSRIGNKCAAVLTSPEDQRIIFLMPWGNRTIIGTTDTHFEGDLRRPTADAVGIDYLLDLVNRNLPEVKLERSDILSTYAGLRPLLTNQSDHPSRASRDHKIELSKHGLWTITGGKLTTYRAMAEDAVDRIVDRLGQKEMRSRTKEIELFAAKPADDPFVRAYGSEAEAVRSLDERTNLSEAKYCLHHERAVYLGDILARRKRSVLFSEDQGRAEAKEIAEGLAVHTGWSPAQERDRYDDEIALHTRLSS